jgi:hypothetical protein
MMADISEKSIHILFPFVDILGDGYSNFIYDNYILITASNTIVQNGSAAYGEIPVPAYFQPMNEAYGYVPGENCGEIFLDAYTNLSSNVINPIPAVATRFTPLPKIEPWSLNLYVPSPLPI